MAGQVLPEVNAVRDYAYSAELAASTKMRGMTQSLSRDAGDFAAQ
jgi:hypothetical protein